MAVHPRDPSPNRHRAVGMRFGDHSGEELYEAAMDARRNAYAPYSGLEVGAALLTDTGSVFKAANVENASLGLTVCAERAAVFQAVAAGCRRFEAIAVASDEQDGIDTLASCGACLQVLAEFDPSRTLVVVFPSGGNLIAMQLADLLPVRFTFSTRLSN